MIDCPVCNGKGTVEMPRHRDKKIEAAIVKTLADSKFSYRQIARFLGYKSVKSAWLLYNKANKQK